MMMIQQTPQAVANPHDVSYVQGLSYGYSTLLKLSTERWNSVVSKKDSRVRRRPVQHRL